MSVCDGLVAGGAEVQVSDAGEREADYHTLAYKKIPFKGQTHSWKTNSSQVSAYLEK